MCLGKKVTIRVIQFVTSHVFVIICKNYKQFLSENYFYIKIWFSVGAKTAFVFNTALQSEGKM